MSSVMYRTIEEAMSEEADASEDGAKPAINIAVLLQIMSLLGPIIGRLPCFGGVAEAEMADGGDVAMIGAWRAVLGSGYEGDRASLAMRLVAKAKAATDEERREAARTAMMVG